MALFDDVLAEVYTLTNRSDLVAETKIAIKQATLAAHRSDVYPKDFREVSLPLTSAAIFSLDIPSYLSNWRSIGYIRPWDSVSASGAKIVLGPDEEIHPDKIFDQYLDELVNVWYVAGTNLNIKLDSEWDTLVIGYYQNPVLNPEASYESWIAREQPAAIVLDATKRVFEAIGYNEAAARLGIMLYGPIPGNPASPTGGEYMLLKSTYLSAGGR